MDMKGFRAWARGLPIEVLFGKSTEQDLIPHQIVDNVKGQLSRALVTHSQTYAPDITSL